MLYIIQRKMCVKVYYKNVKNRVSLQADHMKGTNDVTFFL